VITEYDIEPVPGLPEKLPVGEAILWQGSPDWKRLALSAFRIRGVAIYFGLLMAFGAVQGAWTGVLVTLVAGLLGIAILTLIAWGAARTTLYTLTNKRVVMRIGIALPKCINLPLSLIESADLALAKDGTGDIPLAVTGAQRLGYAVLWPHARPWKLAVPQPMLRAVPDAANVAQMLARACGTRATIDVPAPAPARMPEAVAA
jgi:Bacterial PH domain